MNGSLVIVDDVASAFAQLLQQQIKNAAGSPFSIAFSGGSTARECYEALAENAATAVEWSSVSAWWGDERCVPLDDEDSNFRLVSEALLDRVGTFQAVYPMRSDIPDAAEVYNNSVASAAPIDFIHLGLGPDGHTASLFPESTALFAPPGRFVVSNHDPLGSNPHERLTFTYEGIHRCRMIVVTVAGQSKREALQRVRDGDLSAPASALDGDNLIWLVDHLAMGS